MTIQDEEAEYHWKIQYSYISITSFVLLLCDKSGDLESENGWCFVMVRATNYWISIFSSRNLNFQWFTDMQIYVIAENTHFMIQQCVSGSCCSSNEPQTYSFQFMNNNEPLWDRIHQLSVLKTILSSLWVLLYRNNEHLLTNGAKNTKAGENTLLSRHNIIEEIHQSRWRNPVIL